MSLQKFAIYLLLISLAASNLNNLEAQNKISSFGNYFVDIYTAEDYQAHSQNWAIAQDSAGRMYFGNSNGLLVFNGISWRLFELQNSSIVRSIYIKNNRIYVGAQNEFGFFEPDSSGKLIYHSLINLLPDSTLTFNDIWSIAELNSAIYFQSNNCIIRYFNNKIDIWNTNGIFSFISSINNYLYIHDSTKGLYRCTNESKELIKDSYRGSKIVYILFCPTEMMQFG